MDYKINVGDQVIEMFPSENGKGRVRRHGLMQRSPYAEDLREDYASLGIKAFLRKPLEGLSQRTIPFTFLAAIGIQPAVGP